MQSYQLNYAGHPLRVSFLDPGTRFLFRPLPQPVDGEPDLRVSREFLEEIRPFLPPEAGDSFVEYRCLLGLTARFLLHYDCCIFHAVAFRWRDRAWLLTAPPGTGKTTQYLNWQRLFSGEIQMISGSAPLGGLVLLEQGKEDRIVPLSAQEGLVPLLRQFMVYTETEEEILRIAGLLERMLLTAPHWKMVNRGGDASTRLLRETLEQSIQEAE